MNKLTILMAVALIASTLTPTAKSTVSLKDEYYPWQIVGAVEVCPDVLQVDAERDGEHVRFYHSLVGDVIESYRCSDELRRTGQGGMSPF